MTLPTDPELNAIQARYDALGSGPSAALEFTLHMPEDIIRCVEALREARKYIAMVAGLGECDCAWTPENPCIYERARAMLGEEIGWIV
jgi:hypothetical protein